MRTIIESNGSKWAGEEPDNIEVLKERIKQDTLCPSFEEFGNFIQAPDEIEWIKPIHAEEYKGLTHFSGNFYNVSHCFSIYTDDAETIKDLTTLIRANQRTDRYKRAKEALKSSYWNRENFYKKKAI